MNHNMLYFRKSLFDIVMHFYAICQEEMVTRTGFEPMLKA